MKESSSNGNDISSFSNESTREVIDDLSVQGYQYRSQKNTIDISEKSHKFFKLMWLSMVFVLSILIAHYFIIGTNDLLAVGREDASAAIEIPKNATKSQVANILEENGVIREKSFFKLYTFLTRSFKNIVYGNFEIKKNLDYEAIINFLQSNSNRSKGDIVEVMFQEGNSCKEFSEILQKNNICDSDEFIEKCNSDDFDEDFEFLRNLPRKNERNYKLEGFLFPDTYKFYKNSKSSDVIRKFLNNYERKVYQRVRGSKEPSIINKIKEKNYDVNEILTLASMIQLEASSKKEMYTISSVFRNRLNTISNGGVSKYGEHHLNFLESDVTTWYPYKSRESIPSNIVETFIGEYDTYKNTGLPLGPVCNPGFSAIDAAVNPEDTNYYYFCHDKSKVGYFAKSRAEHDQNLKKAGIR